jgi:hypothetical protein
MASATVVMDGHILDSLLLPKVLDLIVGAGAEYTIDDISIGRTRHDASHAVIRIEAADAASLERLLAEVAQHGARVLPN